MTKKGQQAAAKAEAVSRLAAAKDPWRLWLEVRRALLASANLEAEKAVEVLRQELRQELLSAKKQRQPPLNLELLLHLFIPQSDCEPLVGDLEERYRKLVKRLGIRRADLWYTKQVLTSIWPLLRAGLGRMGSSAAIGVIAFVPRVFGMGRIADELKQVVRRRKRE